LAGLKVCQHLNGAHQKRDFRAQFLAILTILRRHFTISGNGLPTRRALFTRAL